MRPTPKSFHSRQMNNTSPTPPRVSPLDLPALTPLAGTDLFSYGSYEAFHIERADLVGMDLSGAQFLDCVLSIVDAATTDLSHVRFANTRLEQWNAPELGAARASLRHVEVLDSRLGATELFDSRLQSVRFEHCKIGWLNLRASHIRDVEFIDCVIDELDVAQANIERLRLSGCTVSNLNFEAAKLTDIDLTGAELQTVRGLDHMRGVTITMTQAIDLLQTFTTHFGIKIQ